MGRPVLYIIHDSLYIQLKEPHPHLQLLTMASEVENSTANCSMVFYNQRRFVHVAVSAATASTLSFLACLFAVFIVILFKKWQSFGQRMITYLIISVTLFSLATSLRRVDFDEDFTPADRRFCAFTAFAVQTSSWLVIDSIVAITMYLFLGVVWNKFTDKYEYLYVIFIFVFPSTFGWIPFIHNTFGRSGAWCWIRLIDFTTCEIIPLGEVLQLLMFHVPLLIILPSIILAYLVILCTLSRKRKHWKGILDDTSGHTNRIVTAETAYLLVYPMIYFFLTLPLVVTRIQSWVVPRYPVIPLWYITAICFNLHGTAISLAFLLNKDNRNRLRWSHMRAAFKNFIATKGISEYATKEVEGEAEQEIEMSGRHKAPYARLTDDSFWDQGQLEPL